MMQNDADPHRQQKERGQQRKAGNERNRDAPDRCRDGGCREQAQKERGREGARERELTPITE